MSDDIDDIQDPRYHMRRRTFFQPVNNVLGTCGFALAGMVLWYGLGRPVIISEIGNWSVFVLLGWRFVFVIIIK